MSWFFNKIKWQQQNDVISIDTEKVESLSPFTWEQEDIPEIFSEISSGNEQLTLKSTHVGADRVSYEVCWFDSVYWLHFECYSQSIWFEALDSTAMKNINPLYDYLTGNA
ncbi:DUF3630 family protein [Thalassotalea hakodatensis]|uniref:DUF3630 family protein n=1 Tax=Thalassotalea hakodatensis TaxID=3030492 RepID=UPI002572E443|nr:DUF3630 family protein [Thalassotalea hakodatensis]